MLFRSGEPHANRRQRCRCETVQEIEHVAVDHPDVFPLMLGNGRQHASKSGRVHLDTDHRFVGALGRQLNEPFSPAEADVEHHTLVGRCPGEDLRPTQHTTFDSERPFAEASFVLGLPRWWQPATARLKAARSTSRRIHTSFLPAGVQYCRGGMARTTRQRLPFVASLLGVGSGVVWSFGTIAGRRANHADVFQYLFWRSIGIVLVIELIALARRQPLRIKAAWTSGRTMAIANLGLFVDRKSTRLNSSHIPLSRMPSSA